MATRTRKPSPATRLSLGIRTLQSSAWGWAKHSLWCRSLGHDTGARENDARIDGHLAALYFLDATPGNVQLDVTEMLCAAAWSYGESMGFADTRAAEAAAS